MGGIQVRRPESESPFRSLSRSEVINTWAREVGIYSLERKKYIMKHESRIYGIQMSGDGAGGTKTQDTGAESRLPGWGQGLLNHAHQSHLFPCFSTEFSYFLWKVPYRQFLGKCTGVQRVKIAQDI